MDRRIETVTRNAQPADERLQEAARRYQAELDRVDPEHEDGILGASVNQDARAAVDDAMRGAAWALLGVGRALGMDTSG